MLSSVAAAIFSSVLAESIAANKSFAAFWHWAEMF
jgi:hypothetical protein